MVRQWHTNECESSDRRGLTICSRTGSVSAGQDVSCGSWNSKLHCLVYLRPPLVCMLSQLNPVNFLTLISVRFILILYCDVRLPRRSLPFRFSISVLPLSPYLIQYSCRYLVQNSNCDSLYSSLYPIYLCIVLICVYFNCVSCFVWHSLWNYDTCTTHLQVLICFVNFETLFKETLLWVQGK